MRRMVLAIGLPIYYTTRHRKGHVIMALFVVTETQNIRYTWLVEADTAAEAELTARDGVPDAARENLTGSDVTAEPLATDAGTEPPAADIVLGEWEVFYEITSGVGDGDVVADSSIIVRGRNEDDAREIAIARIEDTDGYYDSRIDPSIVIGDVAELED